MANGLLDLLGGALGTTPPAYLQGLLGENAVEDLRKRSIGSGLVNALIGYAAAPKNQDLGLGRILAGAAQSGIEGAQNVYKGATQDYLQTQQLAEMKRQQDQRVLQQQAIEQAATQFPEYANAIRANPELLKDIVVARMKPMQRKTFVAPDGSIRFEDTGEVANQANVAAPRELKAPPTYKVQRGRTEYTIQIQPDGTEKIIGQGSMDAPQQPKEPKEPSYTVRYDANGNAVYVPNKPNMPAIDMMGNPIIYKPALSATAIKTQEKVAQANSLPAVIKEAENLIQNATGSYIGAGVDALGRVVGLSTEGAKNIAGLKALEANLILTMPRLEGPQSNLDQLLYRQAAGQIGDPTVPNDTKLAALKTIKGISAKKSAIPSAPAGSAPANTMDAVQQELAKRKGKK
jgi:hypothetical protein